MIDLFLWPLWYTENHVHFLFIFQTKDLEGGKAMSSTNVNIPATGVVPIRRSPRTTTQVCITSTVKNIIQKILNE